MRTNTAHYRVLLTMNVCSRSVKVKIWNEEKRLLGNVKRRIHFNVTFDQSLMAAFMRMILLNNTERRAVSLRQLSLLAEGSRVFTTELVKWIVYFKKHFKNLQKSVQLCISLRVHHLTPDVTTKPSNFSVYHLSHYLIAVYCCVRLHDF